MFTRNSYKSSDSPFGMVMPGRTWKAASSNGYGFGFNGKLKDDDIMGISNSYDFGARIYDARIGRWLATDRLQKEYPDLSVYQFGANNPVFFIDPDGKKIIPGKNWSPGWKRTYKKLYAKSDTYKSLVQSFKGKNYDYKLNADMKSNRESNASTYVSTVNPEVSGNIAVGSPEEIEFRKTHKLEPGSEITTDFSDRINDLILGGASYEFNDLGRAFLLIHEAVHAKKMLEKTQFEIFANGDAGEAQDHAQMAADRSVIIQAMTEYNDATGKRLSEQDINDVSYLGLLNTNQGVDFIVEYSKRTWGVEIDKTNNAQMAEYYDKVKDSLYKKISDKKK